VLSFTLWVTDSLGMICDWPDTVTITVTDRTVAGLTAANDGPTGAGQPVNFTASITQGTNVSYTWAFGDGITGIGRTPDHTYTTAGPYTAVVTAANSANVLTATTTVTVTRHRLYLPLVMRGYVAAPDLVVARLEATANDVRVVVRNRGNAPATDDFWVDVYVDPAPAPTAVNQIWPDLAEEGLVWGVEADLAAGAALTLTVGGDFYWAAYSAVDWPLAAGTPVYAQVDSANADTTYGGVREDHEITGGPYNNVLSTTVAAGGASAPAVAVEGLPASTDLPPRRAR
jgi:PKD repeat protein